MRRNRSDDAKWRIASGVSMNGDQCREAGKEGRVDVRGRFEEGEIGDCIQEKRGGKCKQEEKERETRYPGVIVGPEAKDQLITIRFHLSEREGMMNE